MLCSLQDKCNRAGYGHINCLAWACRKTPLKNAASLPSLLCIILL